MAKLDEHNFLSFYILGSQPACMQTAEASVEQEQKVMLTQLRVTMFKCAHELACALAALTAF